MKMIRAGRLRHRIQIQSQSATVDAGGGISNDGWTTMTDGDRWAEVKPSSSSERFEAAQRQEVVTHKITTRYLPGVTTRHSVLFGSRRFDIVSVINWGERNVELSLMCVERKAA